MLALRALRTLTAAALRLPRNAPSLPTFASGSRARPAFCHAHADQCRFASSGAGRGPLLPVSDADRQVLSALGGNKRAAVLDMVDQIGEDMSRANVLTWMRVLMAAVDGDTVISLYERMLRMGVEPDTMTYSFVIRSIGAVSPERAEAVFEDMVARGVAPNSYVFGSLIEVYAAVGDVDRAEHWWRSAERYGVERLNTTFASTMISACARAGQPVRAERIYAEMVGAGLRPTLQTLNSLVNAFGKAGMFPRAEHYVHEVYALGMQPNVVTYNALISAAADACLPDRAQQYFEELVDTGLEPNSWTFTAIIKAFGSVGDLPGAEHYFATLQTREVPGVYGFNAVIDACAKARRLDLAERYLKMLEASGIAPTVMTYHCMLQACGRTNNLSALRHYLAEMERAGFTPDSYTALLTFDAIAKHPAPDAAELSRMRAHFAQRGVRLGTAAYTSLIDAWTRCGRAVDAFTAFETMLRDGVRPDEATFCALIDTCGVSGRVHRVRLLFERMRSFDLRPTLNVFNAAVAAYLRAGNFFAAVNVLKELQREGLLPSYKTVGPLLRFLADVPSCAADASALLGRLGDDAVRERSTYDTRANVERTLSGDELTELKRLIELAAKSIPVHAL
eukprot:TRINITY_DN6877_c0_g1_i1.p1 TRINITY_DN6877_c0_g1~~TRINITY_DN6877_c0_g1_i1.p1  ORF type:complete len:621 (+),score=224.14 TRINITY_DN6877_c0_g1_i1:282-2144(+)